MECLHHQLKSRHLFVVLFYYIRIWYFKLGTIGKKRKRKAILLLAYIADVSCLTNHFFYMQTLSLRMTTLFVRMFIFRFQVILNVFHKHLSIQSSTTSSDFFHSFIFNKPLLFVFFFVEKFYYFNKH